MTGRYADACLQIREAVEILSGRRGTFDKTMYVTVDDKVYLLSPIERNHKVSKDFDQGIEKHKPRKKYIPPMTHPWQAVSFRRQQQRAHQYGCYA